MSVEEVLIIVQILHVFFNYWRELSVKNFYGIIYTESEREVKTARNTSNHNEKEISFMLNVITGKTQYNNCFVLGGKSKNNGKPIKVPMFIDKDGYPAKLWGGKNGTLRRFYEMSYEQASRTLNAYLNGSKRVKGDESLRVSLYLDNAMYGNLHIFVIDFDRFDENSGFFQSAKNLADKVTRSQGGGYHMFYGVNKEAATPLFDSINLLASGNASSYICHTGAVTLDGANKVDLFCDARHFIYEWEEWDNAAGLTDRTQSLFELLRDNFTLKRPMEAGQHGTRRRAADGGAVVLDDNRQMGLSISERRSRALPLCREHGERQLQIYH